MIKEVVAYELAEKVPAKKTWEKRHFHFLLVGTQIGNLCQHPKEVHALWPINFISRNVS